MTPFDQAQAAARKLEQQLGDPDWLKGFAITFMTDSFFLLVLVSEAADNEAVEQTIPKKVDGVRTVLAVIFAG